MRPGCGTGLWRGLGGRGRRRAACEEHRPVGVQDRQRPCAGVGGAVPARSGPGRVGALARGAGAARAAASTPAPGQAAQLGQEPHLRAADPMGAALARSIAATGWAGAARRPRCARGLAALRRRGAGRDRPARRTDCAARRRAVAAGAGRPAGRAARHDPLDRHIARSHDRHRDRPGRPLRQSAQADRLRRAGPQGAPVR